MVGAGRVGGLRAVARSGLAVSAAIVLSSLAPLLAQAQRPAVALEETFDAGWRARWTIQPLSGRVTRFAAVSDNGDRVLEGDADRAAAAAWRALRPPSRLTSLTWRWKVEQPVVSTRSERDRAGDDFAARIMVAFGDPTANGTDVIAYVWARGEEAGASFPNPYRANVATLVLRGPQAPVGSWLLEQRDVPADYRSLFGEAAPAVAAIAFVVDSDDTGTRARGRLDDLRGLAR